MMTIKITDDRAAVITPYNPDFVRKIKSIGGAKWDGTAWTVPAATVDRVREIMVDVYGESDISGGEYASARVEYVEDSEEQRGPITFCGKIIASAFGRDSGARVGADAVLITGQITSGGSARYWRTIIKAGAVFEVHKIPRAALDSELAEYTKDDSGAYTDGYVKVSIIGEDIDKEALMARRAALLAELADIDAKLGIKQ